MDYNFKIGNFEGVGNRKRPNNDMVSQFLSDNSSVWKDFDVYLWGSYPDNKKTWDVDFLVHAPQGIDTEQMEEISVRSLENSIIKNKFLADIGFSDEQNMIDFNNVMNTYNTTGNKTPTTGYIYADKWYAGDSVFRDRNKITEGILEEMDNNMYKKTSFIPYPKMVNNIKKDINYYKDKPMLVSRRGE